MADSSTDQEMNKMSLEYLVTPDSKKAIDNYQSNTKGLIWQPSKDQRWENDHCNGLKTINGLNSMSS